MELYLTGKDKIYLCLGDEELGYFQQIDNFLFYIHTCNLPLIKNNKNMKFKFLNGRFNPIFINEKDILIIQEHMIRIIIEKTN